MDKVYGWTDLSFLLLLGSETKFVATEGKNVRDDIKDRKDLSLFRENFKLYIPTEFLII